MLRKMISICICLCLVLSLSAPVFGASSTSVSIDGTPVAFTESTGTPFIDSNSRTLVPLRVAMESYGCQVYWDNENSKAIVYKDGVTVVCPINQSYIEVNGERIQIDTAAIIKNGRTYLPIRCVLEAMGATVGWDGATRTVLVTSGDTDVLLHQEAYIEKAMAAIDANTNLSAEVKASIKDATTKFLGNVPVNDAQTDKICARLKSMRYRTASLSGDEAGKCSTSDDVNFTITMDSGKMKSDDHFARTLFHELCHMFSNVHTNAQNETSLKWFVEGMTVCLEQDIVGGMTGYGYDLEAYSYDAYFRVCRILCELLGPDVMLEAYLDGKTNLIFDTLNQYAGTSDAKTVLSRNINQMTKALFGGVFTWIGDSQGKTKDEWQVSYDAAVSELKAFFQKAYEGKYGGDIYKDPIFAAYFAWIDGYTFSSTAMIVAKVASSNSEYISYYGKEHYRSFALIKDKEGQFCSDKELIVYRY